MRTLLTGAAGRGVSFVDVGLAPEPLSHPTMNMNMTELLRARNDLRLERDHYLKEAEDFEKNSMPVCAEAALRLAVSAEEALRKIGG